MDRPSSDQQQNSITLDLEDNIQFEYPSPTNVNELRIQFDLDYSRQSVSPNRKMQVFALKLHTGRDFVPMKVASTIVKAFEVYADGKLLYKTDNNYHSLVKIPINKKITTLKVNFINTWGADKIKLFACDLY